MVGEFGKREARKGSSKSTIAADRRNEERQTEKEIKRRFSSALFCFHKAPCREVVRSAVVQSGFKYFLVSIVSFIRRNKQMRLQVSIFTIFFLEVFLSCKIRAKVIIEHFAPAVACKNVKRQNFRSLINI